MKKKNFFLQYFLLVAIILAGCKRATYTEKNTGFQFDGCHATYKGKPLPFDSMFNTWVNMFGKYNRQLDNLYVWDSLGFFLFKTDEGYVYALHICFENLESPIGQAGELDYANHYESYEHVLKRNAEGGYIYNDEEKKSLKEVIDSNPVTKYPYPLKTYNDTVLVAGGLVAKGMSLKDVNYYRKQAGAKTKFGYWDTDMNLKNESGSTSVETGEFVLFVVDNEAQKCAVEDKYYILTSLRFTKGILEHIKIQKVKKGKSFYWN